MEKKKYKEEGGWERRQKNRKGKRKGRVSGRKGEEEENIRAQEFIRIRFKDN